MRFIDADDLIAEIKNKMPMGAARGVFLAFVDDAPTAYDLEDVTEQLSNLSSADADYTLAEDLVDRKLVMAIVRKGGVNDGC